MLLVVISSQIRKDAVQSAQRKNEVVDPEPDYVPPALPAPPAARFSPEPVELAQSFAPPTVDPIPAPEPVPRATPRELAQIDELNSLARKLSGTLEQKTGKLRGAQLKTAALRRQLDATSDQERKLSGRIQQTLAEAEAASRQLREGRIEKQQVEELITESDELIKGREQDLASPRFSIVPYDGQTGTIRRPIVIECEEDSIRFAAEGITLEPKTLQGYTPEQNPLLAGVLALAEYWSETDRASGDGRVLRPYPLILVRPDGADSFEVARALLDRLTGNFGYELIEDEFEFASPESTDEAQQRCREAITTAYKLKPTPLRLQPKPKAIDSSAVRHVPAASGSFFKSDAFRQRAQRGGFAGNGQGTGRSGSPAGQGNGVPGMFASMPAGTGRPGRGTGPDGSRPAQPPGSDTASTTKPSQNSAGGQPPARLPFDLLNPPDRPGGSSPSGAAAGTDNTRSGSGTASTGSASGPASSGSTSGPSSSGGPSGGLPNLKAPRRWGIVNPNASLELEQKVTLIVGADQIAVANKYAVSRKPEGSSFDMVNRTVQALDQVAREWGRPPERFFWVPSVTLGVEPGAAELGLLLSRTLRKEGLEVKVVDLKR